MKKYDFDLILSNEVMRKNRLKMIQEDKEKRENKLTMIIALALSILIILLLIHDNKDYKKEDLSKCENGTIEILTAREYPNQVETFCK